MGGLGSGFSQGVSSVMLGQLLGGLKGGGGGAGVGAFETPSGALSTSVPEVLRGQQFPAPPPGGTPESTPFIPPTPTSSTSLFGGFGDNSLRSRLLFMHLLGRM